MSVIKRLGRDESMAEEMTMRELKRGKGPMGAGQMIMPPGVRDHIGSHGVWRNNRQTRGRHRSVMGVATMTGLIGRMEQLIFLLAIVEVGQSFGQNSLLGTSVWTSTPATTGKNMRTLQKAAAMVKIGGMIAVPATTKQL